MVMSQKERFRIHGRVIQGFLTGCCIYMQIIFYEILHEQFLWRFSSVNYSVWVYKYILQLYKFKNSLKFEAHELFIFNLLISFDFEDSLAIVEKCAISFFFSLNTFCTFNYADYILLSIWKKKVSSTLLPTQWKRLIFPWLWSTLYTGWSSSKKVLR